MMAIVFPWRYSDTAYLTASKPLQENFYIDVQKTLERTEARQEVEATFKSGNMVIYTPTKSPKV